MDLHLKVWNTVNDGFLLAARDSSKLIFGTEPVQFIAVFIVSLMVACFVVSVFMDNYSQVDRWWSLLPPLIIGFYWYRSPVSDARLTTMFVLSLLWGMRLTYNFWRKGGYHVTDEDYRWQPLKAAIRPYPLWLLFNIFFICIFQITLLFLISFPADVVFQTHGKVPFGSFDAILMFAFLTLLTFETIADQQQWVFQNEKYRLIENKLPLTGDYKLGFLTHGLFQFSRHPNFFCEVSLWWVMYGFGVSATGQWINSTIVGPILLTLLFQGSTNFTEKLSIQKYPDYVKYQQTTSRLIPFIPGKPLTDAPAGNGIKSPKNKAPGSPKGTKKSAAATPSAPIAPIAAAAVVIEVTKEVEVKKPIKRSSMAPSTESKPTSSTAKKTAGGLNSTPSKGSAAKNETAKATSSGTKHNVLTSPGSRTGPRKSAVVKHDHDESSDEEIIVSPTRTRGQKTSAPLSPKGRVGRK
jgi:steroid 5-alpha reductase family enzyme